MPESAASLSLKGQFLIALPSLTEGIFAQSVTYLCEHDENGAMGIVVNRPLELGLDDVFRQLDLPTGHEGQVLAGGPVSTERGFVLHNDDPERWDSSLVISPEVALTSSLDILKAIAHGGGPANCLVALGYAGWAPGQLESEIQSNAWLTVTADTHILFELAADKRYNACLAKLGVSREQLSADAGNA